MNTLYDCRHVIACLGAPVSDKTAKSYLIKKGDSVLKNERSSKMIKYTTHRALKFVQSSLAKIGIGVMRNEALIKLKEEYWQLKEAAIGESNAGRDLQFLLGLPNHQGSLLLKYLTRSKAEFRQDLFVLSS